MSIVEPETKAFLVKVVNTVGYIVLWAMLNMIIGIFLGWAFYSDSPKVGNYVYYVFLLATTVMLLWLLYKKWK